MEEMKENIPKELIEAFENNYNANWDDPVMRSERLTWCAAWASKPDAQAAPQTTLAPVAAIQFALETDEGLAFLRCWNEGNFDVIRREWPEAPEAVFVGADPLHPATVI